MDICTGEINKETKSTLLDLGPILRGIRRDVGNLHREWQTGGRHPWEEELRGRNAARAATLELVSNLVYSPKFRLSKDARFFSLIQTISQNSLSTRFLFRPIPGGRQKLFSL
jgi:hypothetical protein